MSRLQKKSNQTGKKWTHFLTVEGRREMSTADLCKIGVEKSYVDVCSGLQQPFSSKNRWSAINVNLNFFSNSSRLITPLLLLRRILIQYYVTSRRLICDAVRKFSIAHLCRFAYLPFEHMPTAQWLNAASNITIDTKRTNIIRLLLKKQKKT